MGLADGVAADQFAAALVGLGRQVELGRRRPALGFGLADQGMLKLGLGIDIDAARFGRLDIGDRLRQPGAVVAIVDAEQHVTGPDGLVVVDLDRRDVAGNLRGERGDVAAHIGVVGRCRAARTSPGPSAGHDHHGAEAQHKADHLLRVGSSHDDLR
ncbi:hypothetical protein ABIA13_000884 [Sinorhizobium fredii]